MNSIVIKLLEIKTALINLYYNVKCKLTNTTSFMIDQQNQIYRYYLIQILTKIKQYLQELIELLNVKGELIECTKIVDDKNITMIFETKYYNSMSDIINHLNTIEHNNSVNTNILLKCELNNYENKTCLKEYILKYNDTNKNYNNTLGNILKLNNIDTTTDTKLEITIFKNTKLQQLNILYHKYKDYHLNDFIDSLYEDE